MRKIIFVHFLAGFMVLTGFVPAFAADKSNILIEMERRTSMMVRIAIPKFVLTEHAEDPEGLGGESRKIIENDLRLSEFFIPMRHEVFEDQEKMEVGKSAVDYPGWSQMGAQWLVRTEYQVDSREKTIHFTFRLYDIANKRLLLGKRYSADKKHLRKITHRFSDELVLELTGKRGVAETKLAFLSQEDDEKQGGRYKEIYIIDFDGENLRKLTDEKTIILTPAWSPDGEWIVYTSYAARNPDLVMINARINRGKKTLLKLPGLNAAPAWSPGGERIALVLSKDQNSEIYSLGKNFGLRRLTRHFNIDTSPTWSPDGGKIAFTSDRSGTGAPQIYVMNAEKGDEDGVKRITFGSSYNDNPAWSPNGDKIAYTARVGRKFQIKIYDFNGKKSKIFTKGGGSSEQPSWSPDGRFIVYRHRENQSLHIYVKSLRGGKPRQLSFYSEGGFSPAWSPYPRR